MFTCWMLSEAKLELMRRLRLWRLHIRCEAGRADNCAQAARAAARRDEPTGRLAIRAAERVVHTFMLKGSGTRGYRFVRLRFHK